MQATMLREKGDEAFLEEDDDDPFDLDAASNSSVEGDEEPETDSDGNGLDDGISLAEGSDDADLVAMDDIPNGLIEYDDSDADTEQSDEEWGGISGGDKRKRKGNSQAKRKKRKTLPTFATYEEYARMIEEGPDDDI